jgi:hypothetical protein
VVNPTRALPPVTAAPATGYAPPAEHYPVSRSPRPAAPEVWEPGPERRGGVGRVLRAVLVTLLLIATPVLAAYISYQVTTGQALWPITLNY